jgi:hypothetical protein
MTLWYVIPLRILGDTMRGLCLNGWQRIGIVLSVVWAIVAWLYTRHADVDVARDMHDLASRACVHSLGCHG